MKRLFSSIWLRARLPLSLLYCRLFGLSRPLIVVLTTNVNCNWSCSYCYGDYPAQGAEKNLSTEELERVIDELVDLGCVYAVVHGGEALLRKDLGRLVAHMKARGLYVALVTNGELFPRRLEDLRAVDSLTVSLDGREENNDKNRGPGAFRHALNAVKLASAEGFKVRVSCTVTRHNKGDLAYLAGLAKELKFPVMFSVLFRTDFSKADDGLALSAAEIRAALAEIKELKRRGFPLFTSDRNLDYALSWPYERFNKLYMKRDQVPAGFRKLDCHYGRFKFHVEGDGRIMPCTPQASNGFSGLNAKDVGVRAALDHASKTNDCVACPFLTQNDWNLLMGADPRDLSRLAVEQFKELTRLF